MPSSFIGAFLSRDRAPLAACRFNGRPAPEDSVVFGEIGLSGEVRPVAQTEARLKEAAKLGFARAIAPRQRRRGGTGSLKVRDIGDIGDLLGIFGDQAPAARAAALGGAEA